MNLLKGFFDAWNNLMNLFDYDIPNLTNSNYVSANV